MAATRAHATVTTTGLVALASLCIPAGDASAQGSVETDRAALVAFYNATAGPNWKNNANWLTDAPLSNWHGVATDENGRVRKLDLSLNGLNGPLPSELGHLASLEQLWLGGNALTGPIPSGLGDLADLRALALWRNRLTGPIPSTLGNLPRLEVLILWGNRLTGPIAHELARLTRLVTLDLEGNDLTGPIPPGLGNLRNLVQLELKGNLLEGEIPAALGHLAELRVLRLAFNERLTGPLPSGLQRAQLWNLDLAGTTVCAPADAAFQTWLETIEEFRSSGLFCGTPAPAIPTIDVAVFYTPAARAAAGGTAEIEAEIDLMVAEGNQAYVDSGVHQRIALVAREEIQYTEVLGELDYNRLREPSDGFMDEVHEVRDRVGADLVHLVPQVVAGYGLCGRAGIPGAFGLTGYGCGGRTFVHELGHNMGLQHDRYSACGPGTICVDWPFRYGYGYVNPRALEPGAPDSARWFTIMAYSSACNSMGVFCRPVLRFSNPRQTWEGDPLGVEGDYVATDVNGPADAVRVLNVMRHSVASLRDRVVGSPPVAVGALPDRTLHVSGGPVVVSVADAFRDPDGDPLTFSATSSAPGIVTTGVTGAQATLTPVAEGTAEIVVTATDFHGSRKSATHRFAVTVQTGAMFTDHEILPGVTPIRAAHFRELRQRIDAVRERAGGSPFGWTDPSLAAGVTTIRVVHLTELRRALDEAYDARQRPRPRYTDATVTAGVTAMRAAHVMELRAAILALE